MARFRRMRQFSGSLSGSGPQDLGVGEVAGKTPEETLKFVDKCRAMAIDFGSEQGQTVLQCLWNDGSVVAAREFKPAAVPVRFRCSRCDRGFAAFGGSDGYQAHTCLTDAEVAVSLNIQRVFDQQQKRAVALFNGGL